MFIEERSHEPKDTPVKTHTTTLITQYALWSNLRDSNADDDTTVVGVIILGATDTKQLKLKLGHKIFPPPENVTDPGDLDTNSTDTGTVNTKDAQHSQCGSELTRTNSTLFI
ncbi:hypothetical protein F5878DRAFT_667786 [Lentinula raphanica]|uniref:Uncharacterized protein n=1 Tax=Lentinula raphanica TaxID=153919 RepID=A0AA38U2K1_9AGAR|nr:hypothetical protein F5878DRAFT_667786 [Lentinula raphanica]